MRPARAFRGSADPVTSAIESAPRRGLWTPVACGLALASLLAAAPLLSTGVTARPVGQEIDLHEGAYWYLQITSGSEPDGSDIDATWESTRPVDVWLMSSADFEAYKDFGAFGFVQQWSGTSGEVRFNISAEQMPAAPFYLLFDNSGAGPTAPPSGNPSAIASVSFSGDTRMGTYQMGSATLDLGGRAFSGVVRVVAVILLVSILAMFFALRRKRKLRRAAIWSQLRSPPPMEAQGMAASGPPRTVGLPASPAVTAQGTAARPLFCGSCGSSRSPGTSFCRQCGAPF